MAFICLWIAFNAGLCTGLRRRCKRRHLEAAGFPQIHGRRVCALGKGKALSTLVWQVFPDPMRLLLDNRYVFQPFEDALNNSPSDGSIPGHWHEAFDDARQSVQNSSVKCAQVRDGRALLTKVLPVMLEVMMDRPPRFEGKPCHPVVAD